MLRVTDARTGEVAELAVGGTPLRVLVRLPAADGEPGPTGLRVALAADVLARAAELAGRQVVLVRQVPEQQAAGLARAEEELRLLPAEAALGRQPDVTVAAAGAGPRDGAAEAAAEAGGAQRQPGVQEAPGGGPGVLLAVGGVRGEARIPPRADPLALRLALLRHPRSEPFTLTAAGLADAEVQLGRWRRKVAEWANHSSRAIPEDVRRRCDAAVATDLDVPAVLRLLDEVESANRLPDGARFELFCFADRVLGLEMVREIGRW